MGLSLSLLPLFLLLLFSSSLDVAVAVETTQCERDYDLFLRSRSPQSEEPHLWALKSRYRDTGCHFWAFTNLKLVILFSDEAD